jgi:hypothetical protein
MEIFGTGKVNSVKTLETVGLGEFARTPCSSFVEWERLKTGPVALEFGLVAFKLLDANVAKP